MACNYSQCCEDDCRVIHAAWNQPSHLGLALARRTPSETQQIKETYRAMYGEDLVDRLYRAHMADQQNEMCSILYLWMLDAAERDAVLAGDAIGRHVIDYRALVEVYTRRKSNQLFYTKQAYLAKFKRNLDHDITNEPLHPYQRILVALATSHRSHHDDVSRHIAKCDAKRLYDARNGGAGGIDESAILEMFSKRSIPQLRLAFSSYKHIYGHDYTKTLNRDGCGEFEDALRVVVKCIYAPLQYYSKMLHTSMKGQTSGRAVVTRVMIGSADVGMEEVKQVFEKRYQIKLEDAIYSSFPEGDYRDFLVAVTRGSACS